MTESALTTRRDGSQLAVVEDAGNPIEAMLNAVLAKGAGPETAATIEKLTDVFMRVEADRARRAFFVAKAALQDELPVVVGRVPVPNNDGTVRYTYAPLGAIMREIRPSLTRHGFSVAFDSERTEDSCIATCILSHAAGHCERYRFACRVGQGPPKASPAQADGAALTYAKRQALCAALNIVVDQDTDGRAEGDAISPQQANDLRARVRQAGVDEPAFLKFAEADCYENIMSARLPALLSALSQKRTTPASQPPPPELIAKLLDAFSRVGVDRASLEREIGGPLEQATEANLDRLRSLHRDLAATQKASQ